MPAPTETGQIRNILAQKVGVPQKKLETILEVGKLAETGKTKSVSHIYNEVKLLERIEKERAELRQKATQLSGKNVGGEARSAVPNLERPMETGRTLDTLSQKVGVPKMKLDTILEVGKLAETGKTKSERDEEERIQRAEQRKFVCSRAFLFFSSLCFHKPISVNVSTLFFKSLKWP